MGGLSAFLRTNTWTAIGLSALVTAALAALGEWQGAAILGCVFGCLLMWKSEIDNPTVPPPDFEEA